MTQQQTTQQQMIQQPQKSSQKNPIQKDLQKTPEQKSLVSAVKSSLGAALLMLALAACGAAGTGDAGPEGGSLVGLEVTSPGQRELIFSGTTGSTGDAQPISFKNTGDAPLLLSTLNLGGPNAGAFKLDAPKLPLLLGPGSSAAAAVSFSPSTSGTQQATLEVSSNDTQNGAVEIGLYGLGSQGAQGEPSLQQVTDTLGYRVDTGEAALYSAGGSPVGSEIDAPLFERAGEGPVSLSVVARYGPDETLPYGVFTLGADTPTKQEVGRVAAKDAHELLPPLEAGDVSFDPGAEAFGVYAQVGDDVRYSLDGLNRSNNPHALRVYPLRDRSGKPVSGSYLLGLEVDDGSGADYQDALFVVSNVRPVGATPDEALGGWETLFNGNDLSGWYSYLPSKGKNNDPEGVFRAENGVIRILGVKNNGFREFGYLATDKSYSNYHLRLEYRWGETRFAPRDQSKRDSGVVYHVTGRDRVWPEGVEYQIQEGDTGDFWLLGGPTLTTTVASPNQKEPQYAANGSPYTSRSGRFVRIIKDQAHERAGWNTVDIIVQGSAAVHMINGEVNNRAYSLHTPGGAPLSAGKILLQAEGAEVFYRNIQLRQLP